MFQNRYDLYVLSHNWQCFLFVTFAQGEGTWPATLSYPVLSSAFYCFVCAYCSYEFHPPLTLSHTVRPNSKLSPCCTIYPLTHSLAMSTSPSLILSLLIPNSQHSPWQSQTFSLTHYLPPHTLPFNIFPTHLLSLRIPNSPHFPSQSQTSTLLHSFSKPQTLFLTHAFLPRDVESGGNSKMRGFDLASCKKRE